MRLRPRIYLSLKTRLHKYTPRVRGMVLYVAAAAQMQTVGLTLSLLTAHEGDFPAPVPAVWTLPFRTCVCGSPAKCLFPQCSF